MKKNRAFTIQHSLLFFDVVVYAAIAAFLYAFYLGIGFLTLKGAILQVGLSFCCLFGARIFGRVYRQVWRYGGIQCYIRLLICDGIAFFAYLLLERLVAKEHITFAALLAFTCMNAWCSLSMRLFYRFAYKCGSQNNRVGKLLRFLLRVFTGGRVQTEADPDSQKIKIAIIGAGSVGAGLAEELIDNQQSNYIPRCFVDCGPDKIGRSIHGLSVLRENDETLATLQKYHIQEVVFALPNLSHARRLELFNYYQDAGFRIMTYDFPIMREPNQKRRLREIEISDLLFRNERDIINTQTGDYYRDKVILITGGGGSIGSELCRQLAKLSPRQLIIADIYENTAYDLQQELMHVYQGNINLRVEILNICDRKAMEKVFIAYHPDICIHAAAHKHVPLMETNCIEAINNNVFGTLNVLECCEAFGCGRFMLISTDKAVNPTSVMGATKRVCEMITQAFSLRGKVKCSATRFGNVLGSAGSVVPLFKRQIAAGGPVTVTDKRIIRYFMTIPEASQLVLTSGAMANNGDLFVLDMGNPVKIWDLAVNMVAMSGAQDIEIVETGLRPGEKLYEELLIDSENLEKTENELIFIEHETPITPEALEEKLQALTAACETEDDSEAKRCLMQVVPTFVTPAVANAER